MRYIQISENEISEFIDIFNNEDRQINICEIGRLQIKNFLIKFGHFDINFKIDLFMRYCLSNKLCKVVQ